MWKVLGGVSGKVLLTPLSLLLLMGFNGTYSVLFYLSSFVKMRTRSNVHHH